MLVLVSCRFKVDEEGFIGIYFMMLTVVTFTDSPKTDHFLTEFVQSRL